ncbi:MAG: ABC transporter permease [Candidatus Rokuibacteriota bacterium]|jgi:peptide/nickel transport system permease protein
MARFLVSRALQALVSILGVSTIIFVVMHLSGDPTLLLVPEGASREDVELLRHQLGFDRPLAVQYADYLAGLARGDLGTSLVQRVPVSSIVAARLPYTLLLAGGALVVALGIGLPVGVITGVWRGTRVEALLMPVVLVGQSMPTFWSGILLILLCAVTWNVLPASGADSWSSLVMPSITLGALSMATFARLTRTGVVEELGRDYVRASRAKGVATPAIVLRHVLRNASIPIITVAALEIANLLAGAVIVETVFAWPGLGQLAIQSIAGRDFLVVQALVLLASFTCVALNLLADLLYGVVDPRITRLAGAR